MDNAPLYTQRLTRGLPTAPAITLWCWAVSRSAEGMPREQVRAAVVERVEAWQRYAALWNACPDEVRERVQDGVLAEWAQDTPPERMAARVEAQTAIYRMSDRKLASRYAQIVLRRWT